MLSLIRNRRSIRKYQNSQIPQDTVNVLIEAGLRAPSSRGLKPWEFIIFDDPEKIGKLAKAKQHGSSFLATAPLVIMVVADPQCCDVWIEDATIAATYIQLTAQSLGLGSCWVQIRERMHDETISAEDYLREQFKIPEPLRIECIISLGEPGEMLTPHSGEGLEKKKVFYNGYGDRGIY